MDWIADHPLFVMAVQFTAFLISVPFIWLFDNEQ